MSPKSLTVLFTPLDGYGHINACHGIAETLRDRGHRIVFAIDIVFKGKLTPYGFEEEILISPKNDEKGLNFWDDWIVRHGEVFKSSPMDIIEKFNAPGFNQMYDDMRARDPQYKDIIARVKPDIIVIDAYIGSPTLTNSGVPWVWLYSAAPLGCLNSDELPPGHLGLPTNGNKEEWIQIKQKIDKIYSELNIKVNKWLISEGGQRLTANYFHPFSKYLNLYMYPKELDYQELQPLPQNWQRVDGFVRTTDQTFEIPQKLRTKSGKLIFLSMGSYGCAYLELMTRLVGILSKSKHRFIVAKGPLHDKYELPDNMWGQRFVPQTAVLPLVDLVISHGGNNTVTETFFFGKPMLVLPIFGDQFENAQRIRETGLGLRLSPFHCSEEELLKSVDQLVSDEELAQRMKSIGERIRKSDHKNEISVLIEKIVENNMKEFFFQFKGV